MIAALKANTTVMRRAGKRVGAEDVDFAGADAAARRHLVECQQRGLHIDNARACKFHAPSRASPSIREISISAGSVFKGNALVRCRASPRTAIQTPDQVIAPTFGMSWRSQQNDVAVVLRQPAHFSCRHRNKTH